MSHVDVKELAVVSFDFIDQELKTKIRSPAHAVNPVMISYCMEGTS